jgi:hypothetical protein
MELGLSNLAGTSLQRNESSLEGKTQLSPYKTWLLFLLICVLLVAAAFVYIDVPVAMHVEGLFGSAKGLEKGFASIILLSVEAAVALGLVVIRITRGHLSPFREAIALACLTSICAYAINDAALKFFFGVPNPSAVLDGSRHAFNLLSGSTYSSFPSGHMVLAGAFAGAFMRLYRKSVPLFSTLLFIAGLLLVGGDWHFVSDVIAGSFLGVSAGLLAGEVWLAHSK